MDYDIFRDDKERRAALTDLGSLLESPGWKVMLAALDKSIEHEDDLLHNSDFADLSEVSRLQDAVSHLRKLKELPTLLMQDIAGKLEEQTPDDEDLYGEPGLPPAQGPSPKQ
jgi:hypothetical protein